MRTVVAVVAVVTVVIGCGSSKPAPVANASAPTANACSCPDCTLEQRGVATLCSYVDQVCACADTACLDKVNEALDKVVAELNEARGGKVLPITGPDKVFFDGVSQRSGDCIKKVVGTGAASP